LATHTIHITNPIIATIIALIIRIGSIIATIVTIIIVGIIDHIIITIIIGTDRDIIHIIIGNLKIVITHMDIDHHVQVIVIQNQLYEQIVQLQLQQEILMYEQTL